MTMIKIGITGGIGSGKSVVSTLLTVLGYPVYNADTESKKLTNSSPVIRKELIDLFGHEIYSNLGLNKKLLASRIFNDQDLLQRVNGIIHPEVKLDFEKWATRQDAPICSIESAILFESGFDRTVDFSLMVYAPKEVRIERSMRRDDSSREEIERRINSQMADEKKMELSDYIIYNDGKKAIIPQVQQFIKHILR